MRLSKKFIGKDVMVKDCRNSTVSKDSRGWITGIFEGDYEVQLDDTRVVAIEPRNLIEIITSSEKWECK